MAEDALHNSYARMGASVLTWPIEKSKLLFQAQSSPSSSTTSAIDRRTGQRKRLITIAGENGAATSITSRFLALPLSHHAMGISASALQRGGSAFFMFYTQSSIYQHVVAWRQVPSYQPQGDRLQQHPQQYVVNQALAGLLSGAITAPFHTYWELIKVRGIVPTPRMYLLSLLPMIGRHAVFDGLFFGTQASLLQLGESESSAATTLSGGQSESESNSDRIQRGSNYGWAATHLVSSNSGLRFGLAATVASLGNLLWDIWKTRQMAAPSLRVLSSSPSSGHPRRVLFIRDVVWTMTWSSFWRQYLVKGADLTANWFAVGCIKDRFFS